MEIFEPAIYGGIIGAVIVLFIWITCTLCRPTPAVLNEEEIDELQHFEQRKHWLVVVYKKPMRVDLVGGPGSFLEG